MIIYKLYPHSLLCNRRKQETYCFKTTTFILSSNEQWKCRESNRYNFTSVATWRLLKKTLIIINVTQVLYLLFAIMTQTCDYKLVVVTNVYVIAL